MLAVALVVAAECGGCFVCGEADFVVASDSRYELQRASASGRYNDRLTYDDAPLLIREFGRTEGEGDFLDIDAWGILEPDGNASSAQSPFARILPSFAAAVFDAESLGIDRVVFGASSAHRSVDVKYSRVS